MKQFRNIKNSMLWAAYGDAMGFITELCDTKGLQYRTKGLTRITKLIPWQRKIGGRYGVSINLPLGCYSDDTQLRLAVGRSINRLGKFDYEAFSKIEAPVFLSYGLGVGRGTKVACESLQKRSVQWNTNFYDTKGSTYINGGGNGAAMRIQPHVWTSTSQTTITDLITEIIKNTIITHGHPVALVGAVFHGLSLKSTFEHGVPPEPNQWLNILEKVHRIVDVCSSDDQLNRIWVPQWERKAAQSFAQSVHQTISNTAKDIQIITDCIDSLSKNDPAEIYLKSVRAIDGLNPSVRGSATKTAILANLLGHIFNNDPQKGIETCINTLGSDTDTIATMAGAILGAGSNEEPPQRVLDYDYIASEATRFFEISEGKNTAQFLYPDLISVDVKEDVAFFNHLLV